MQINFNYHTHTTLCDGKSTFEDYIKVAFERNIKFLGFSSHYHLNFCPEWTIKAEDIDNYLKIVNELKIKYNNKIEIFLGFEVDYIPGLLYPSKELIQKHSLDYVIGSVHFAGRNEKEEYWPIDGPFDLFEKGLNEIYGGDVQKAVETYYNLITEMVLKYEPTIIGHIDLIKLNNKKEYFFKESEKWYRNIVLKTLDNIAKRNSLLEINTGGITRNKIDSIYPSDWILYEILKRNIKITVSSDAHQAEHLDGYFKELQYILKNIGFKKAYYLTYSGIKEWKIY